jgi:hypothetical protein
LILLLFAIGSSGYKNSLRSRSYVEIAGAAPRATSMQLATFVRKVGFSLKLTPWQQGILSSSPVTGNPAGLVPRNASD